MNDRKLKAPPARASVTGETLLTRRRSGADRIAGTSVHASLATEIGQRIVRGDYPPGTILPNEQQWSQTFDVSRSAVREAIKMLMAKSLLASRPKVGSWVEPRERWNLLDRDVLSWYSAAPNREAFLKTVQEFRYIIEPEATALAAERRSEEQMAEITKACVEMGMAETLPERTAADTRFHLAILRASGNELLVPLGVLIERAFSQLFVFVTREVNDLQLAQALHEKIEKAVRQQRPDAARIAVRKLLKNTDEIISRAKL
ncbi:FadR/GntR family transcriptional regulator [Mesorhizobium sp. BAC0120]|uniref:FadR/GntR family transcriptional regulator n=1 Tax=Mesorhizobium sp. BAC0120 TaxID=3090670 RepID=UPI00298D5123|nr:FadR/GntR family transcriptional regulator [Mesorhizobium sp. BAC0120]MDW6025825.1 FadR/GntR family transcriptional regulator [Mesorhizobium sp. BAC0120]